MSLSVDADISDSVDLFGKTVSELQSNIVIDDDSISGTLKFVDDYTGFSGDTSLQSGNFIVIHVSVPGFENDAVISVKVTNPVTLDDDGIAVLRIADKNLQTITVVASVDGYDDIIKEFSLDELVCEDT